MDLDRKEKRERGAGRGRGKTDRRERKREEDGEVLQAKRECCCRGEGILKLANPKHTKGSTLPRIEHD